VSYEQSELEELVEDSRKYVHEDQILGAASEGGIKDNMDTRLDWRRVERMVLSVWKSLLNDVEDWTRCIRGDKMMESFHTNILTNSHAVLPQEEELPELG
jgi:hypothetical protein